MKITVSAERHIAAPADRVYGYIRDFRQHHPAFLPSQFSDFEVEHGGVGAGTIHHFTLTLGGHSTTYRVRVGEPGPGNVLIESDSSRRMLTTFTVDPTVDGESIVSIETRWYTDGLRGVVERIVIPRMLRRVYGAELALLDRYARQPAPATRRSVLPTRLAASFA
jgi:Polyketide cyclase / dehydrase and lipid transport